MNSNLETIILNDKMGFLDISKHFKKKKESQNLSESTQYLKQSIINIIKQNPKISKEKLQETLLLKQQQEKELNKNFDPSKRKFLKSIGLGAVLLTTAPNIIIDLINKIYGKQILPESEAYADYNYNNIPPGIETCRDKHIKQAYVLARNPTSYYKGVEQIRIFEGIMKISNSMYLPNSFGIINDNTPYIEPAYWFLCAMRDDFPNRIYNKLEKKNKILEEFATGIGNYFAEWVYPNKGYYGMKTEEHLLKSIFAAAGYDMEKKTQEYLNSNFQEKKNIIKNTAKIFQNMNINPKNNQINDNYDKALTAQWASLWLYGHYYRLEGKSKKTILIYNLEQKFKSIGKQKIDLRIRGPPKYNY